MSGLYIHKDLRDLVKVALAAGWVLAVTRDGHLRLRAGGTPQRTIFFSSTPSRPHRERARLRRDLRHAGLEC